MTYSVRVSAVPLLCALALLVGGSAQAVWGNLLLQLVGLLLLGWALTCGEQKAAAREPMLLLSLTVLLIGLQLVPLPPALWTLLPGRAVIIAGFQMRGEPLPWLPLTLAPYDTIAAALMLIPPAAVFLAMVRLGAFRMRLLLGAIIGGASVGVLLGAMQVSAGHSWYPFAFHNAGAATGFFANANHLAALLLATLPFLAVAAVKTGRESRSSPWAVRLGAAGLTMLLLLGLLLTRSSAAILLALPVLGASALLLPRSVVKKQWVLPAASLVLVGMLGALPLLANRDSVAWTSRQQIWTTTIAAARNYAPVGSGLGTFEPVYRMAEDASKVDRTFVNRAHNDWLQVALELGLPGLLLLLAFAFWWVRRAVALWRWHNDDLFARAATIASAALLAHSLVDYPLRTGANSVVLAACLALMAGARPAPRVAARPARHLTV
jgi:O-antigen ligase